MSDGEFSEQHGAFEVSARPSGFQRANETMINATTYTPASNAASAQRLARVNGFGRRAPSCWYIPHAWHRIELDTSTAPHSTQVGVAPASG
jgi:hypothetical protein